MSEHKSGGSPKQTSRKLVFIVILSAALLLLGVLALPLLKDRSASLIPGTDAPDFTLTTYDGSQHTLSDYRGSVVVLNFWASWCSPCQEEAALLEYTYQQHRSDTVFLGIAYSDTESEALAYLEQNSITYPNGPDLGTRISSLYGVSGVPETFIINPQGIIAAVKIGPFTEQAELAALILDAE